MGCIPGARVRREVRLFLKAHLIPLVPQPTLMSHIPKAPRGNVYSSCVIYLRPHGVGAMRMLIGNTWWMQNIFDWTARSSHSPYLPMSMHSLVLALFQGMFMRDSRRHSPCIYQMQNTTRFENENSRIYSFLSLTSLSCPYWCLSTFAPPNRTPTPWQFFPVLYLPS